MGLFTLYALVYTAKSLIKSLFRLFIEMKMKMKMRERYYEILARFYTMDGYERKDSPSSIPSMEMAAVDMNMREAVAAVEGLLCYRFRDKTLLQEALTHSSYTQSPSYQRLEFVVDAALGPALAQYVFRAYPGLNYGQLSLLRAANMSTENLARIAVRHELYRYVRRNAPSLDANVREFVLAIQGEGRAVTNCGSVEAPKILAGIVESIAAAVYVDCNYDFKALWEVLKSFMEPIITLETLPKHSQPTTLLYELCQKRGKKIDIESDEDIKSSSWTAFVYVDDKLIGSGSSGQTKKIAKSNAAKEVLEKLLWEFDHSETETEVGHGIDEIKGAKSKLNNLCRKKRWDVVEYRYVRTTIPSPTQVCFYLIAYASYTTQTSVGVVVN
ncbi:ribonuclease 3-like protein 2 [Telopea speciosissima]|uniref:ribonuclease 3-like protein 2 n=1 Tax=Telopea speciosissima TaxID=54955 RepID=UPI001CC43D34|nr:ribonuclease 3-like protein 2 [Telopea speciosissima]